MALGALIAAQDEDDQGGLHALAPLAGRTLIEYQARCAAAVGAAPIVVMVERVPPTLQTAFERLRSEGISVVPVTDAMEAAARFDPEIAVLQMADRVAFMGHGRVEEMVDASSLAPGARQFAQFVGV